jgi:hypothetical protein
MPRAMKKCSKCGVVKPLSDFPFKYDWRRSPDARKSACKRCENKRRAERRHSGSRSATYDNLLRKRRHALREGDERKLERTEGRLRIEFGWRPR